MTRPLVDNAADPGQIENAKHRARLRTDQLAKDIRELLALPAFRRVLFWLIGQCNVYASPFRTDPHTTALEVGRQETGRMLIAELNAIDPVLYPQFLLQHAEDVKAAEAVKAAERQQRRRQAETLYDEPDAEA